MEKREQITYTLILHQIRKKLKLTLMDYCVCDCVYHLSNNPKSKVIGWCFATKRTIAKMLGTTQQTIFNTLNKMIERKFIEKDEDTRHLRTTSKWFDGVILLKSSAEYQETLHSIKKLDKGLSKNLIPTIKKLDTYNNTYKDNYKEEGTSSYKKKKKPFFRGNPMRESPVGSDRWFVIEDGQWLEFAGFKSEIVWK